MAEYIERRAAREKCCSMCRWEGTENCEECEHPIDDIPAADVVPVVRCKDCRYQHACAFDAYDDFYCASGKRKEDGDGNDNH